MHSFGLKPKRSEREKNDIDKDNAERETICAFVTCAVVVVIAENLPFTLCGGANTANRRAGAES